MADPAKRRGGLLAKFFFYSSMRTCIIGAGPSGLVTLKELRDKSISATIFESGPRIGGSFRTAYPDARMTSSSILTVFSSFADMALPPKIWTCDEYVSYIELFAQKFQLLPHIQFDTLVEDVRRLEDGKWQVTVTSSAASAASAASSSNGTASSAVSSSNGTDTTVVELFDAVAVTTGLNQTPNIPEWARPIQPNITITHSANVRSFEQFKNKNVVLVGLGESGSDMSLSIAKIAKSLKISTRSNGEECSGYTRLLFILTRLLRSAPRLRRLGFRNPSLYCRRAH